MSFAGIHFKTDKEGIINQIAPAMTVVGQALNMLAKSTNFTRDEKRAMVQSNISCESRLVSCEQPHFYSSNRMRLFGKAERALKNVLIPMMEIVKWGIHDFT